MSPAQTVLVIAALAAAAVLRFGPRSAAPLGYALAAVAVFAALAWMA